MSTNSQTATIGGDQPMNTNRQTAIKESKMQITTPKVIRWAGLSAMAAGIIFAGIQPIHPPDVLASVNTSLWAILTSLKLAMCFFFLLGITGLYARQVEASGWLGLVGYLLFGLSWALQTGFVFAEVYILPVVSTAAPEFVNTYLGIVNGSPAEMNIGALESSKPKSRNRKFARHGVDTSAR